jgi:hypothetical protein
MKETFYFSHDYNARADGKIKKLLSIHGMIGYGIFWAIIEDLYQNANALRTDYGCIAYDLRVQETLVKSIVEDFGLFQISGDSFGSYSVERRINRRSEKSQKARESALSRWNKQEVEEEENANAMRTQCDSNAIKESILKDNKVKENKLKRKNITPPPSTEVNTDLRKPSPNDESILDEKQKQKARQLKKYARLSETLYDHIQESKNIKLPKTRIKSWAEDMVKLENINGIDYYRQKEALDWFINHYEEEYMPVIQSGAAFREKFTKIEDAIKRNSQSKRRKSGNTIGHLSPEPIDYGPVARWDEETQTIIPSGKFAQNSK